jgi:hypothetical protein
LRALDGPKASPSKRAWHVVLLVVEVIALALFAAGVLRHVAVESIERVEDFADIVGAS